MMSAIMKTDTYPGALLLGFGVYPYVLEATIGPQ